MHLSNEQLLEPNQLEQKHLDVCTVCQKQLANIEIFRNKLISLPEMEIQSDLFLRIVETNEAYRNKQKLNFWRKSSYGLAASFIFASVLSFYLWQGRFNEQDITTIIALNNELQQVISTNSPKVLVASSLADESALIRRKIKSIDLELQDAYLNSQSESLKKSLWSERLSLLNQLQELLENNRSVVRI